MSSLCGRTGVPLFGRDTEQVAAIDSEAEAFGLTIVEDALDAELTVRLRDKVIAVAEERSDSLWTSRPRPASAATTALVAAVRGPVFDSPGTGC